MPEESTLHLCCSVFRRAGHCGLGSFPGRYNTFPRRYNDLLRDARVSNDEADFRGNPLKKLGKATGVADLLQNLPAILMQVNARRELPRTPFLANVQMNPKWGVCRSSYDWRRDGLRAECKSSQLRWASSERRWDFLGPSSLHIGM